MTSALNFLLILTNVGLAVSGQVAIKYGMQLVGRINAQNVATLLWRSFGNPFIILGLIAYALAAVVWIVVLSRVDLSYAYPMLSIGYVAILAISALYLNETISLGRALGTACIIIGILLIFRS